MSEKNASKGMVSRRSLIMAIVLAAAGGFFCGVMFFSLMQPDPHQHEVGSQGMPPQAGSQQPAGMGGQATGGTGQIEKLMALEKAAGEHPQDAQAWIALGNFHFDAGQPQPAVEAYAKALAIDPKNADVWTDMGVMYRQLGQPQEAVRSFDQAIALDPGHEVSRFNKGIVLMHDLKDEPAAIEAWEGLLAINPAAVSPTGMPVREMVDELKRRAGTTGS